MARADSGAGRTAAALLEEAGIITNMNMLPGDTRAFHPQDCAWRAGIDPSAHGPRSMQEEPRASDALLDGVDPRQVKDEVAGLREDFTEVHYCF
ncbi:MAG: hypothetical protein CM15mP18_3530 [Methanobacteriota archaeon]|nr:MAG: hypothetical protein CM15mP18_3530 [Euryarchaeota archaeon]